MSRSSDKRIARLACVSMLALLGASCLPGRVAAQSVRLAYAWPRGYYPGAGLARIEVPTPIGGLKDIGVSGEIYIASHEGVSSTTLSAYAFVRNEPFPHAIVTPFVAAG